MTRNQVQEIIIKYVEGGLHMTYSCSDVCERIHQMLTHAGFIIDSESEDHADMMDALDWVDLHLRTDTPLRLFTYADHDPESI